MSKSHLLNYVLGILLLLTTTSCVILGYLWIDMSISYTYMDEGRQNGNYTFSLAKLLLEGELVGISENELMEKLNALVNTSSEPIILKKDNEENVIWFENLKFQIRDGVLVKID